MMGNISTSSAWSSSPVDKCLDKLGTCEARVSECETRNFILEAQMAVLRHPKVVIGLACGVAVLLLLALLRCCWHVRAGAVQGAFPFRPLPWLAPAPCVEGHTLAFRPGQLPAVRPAVCGRGGGGDG
jgi:hypothetical protein